MTLVFFLLYICYNMKSLLSTSEIAQEENQILTLKQARRNNLKKVALKCLAQKVVWFISCKIKKKSHQATFANKLFGKCRTNNLRISSKDKINTEDPIGINQHSIGIGLVLNKFWNQGTYNMMTWIFFFFKINSSKFRFKTFCFTWSGNRNNHCNEYVQVARFTPQWILLKYRQSSSSSGQQISKQLLHYNRNEENTLGNVKIFS